MKRRFVRLAVLAAAGAAALAFASSALGGTYIVLYKQQAVPGDAKSRIQRAGGTLVYAYDQIGVAIARSSSTAFASNMAKDDRVEGAVLTAPYATRLSPVQLTASGPPAGGLPNAPATDSDTFSGLQWDMRQIKAPEAHAITGGSPLVVAGDLDTGLDYTHPDLAQNVDFADSTSCESGAPNSAPAAWDDHFGHGTHTAGTIAAAANGIGIVGVAPNVKIAAVKTSNDDGFFFPEMVVCAFMWAGTHHFDVTNNSYFADPWYFNCRNDPVQRAIWKAEQRAILFAENQGVTVVAAATNFGDDMAHPTQDIISPDTGPGTTRRVTNACLVIPAEVPGVIGVSGVGDYRQKAYFSNYGVGVIQLTAPSGDDLQVSPEAPNGMVLSTFPQHPTLLDPFVEKIEDCAPPGGPCAEYAYLEGTSMATPHVTGTAALIISMFGDLKNPQNGKMRPEQVKAYLDQTADPLPCPTAEQMVFYEPFPQFSNGQPQACQGGTGYNSWYGNGEVDALAAVTHTPGNH